MILLDFTGEPSERYSFASQVFAKEERSRQQVKRRVEASMRNASTEAKRKEWVSWLDREAVELVKGRLNVPRSHSLQ